MVMNLADMTVYDVVSHVKELQDELQKYGIRRFFRCKAAREEEPVLHRLRYAVFHTTDFYINNDDMSRIKVYITPADVGTVIKMAVNVECEGWKPVDWDTIVVHDDLGYTTHVKVTDRRITVLESWLEADLGMDLLDLI